MDKIIKNSTWKNNKKNTFYIVLNEGIDCTNERDGLIVVVYQAKENSSLLFVREKKEFLDKFTFIK
ncbi:MAG: DUF1653 domain-containing protein [Fusobacteriaceae bacterium]|jgi:hypothetical protein|nr:DUF1653 domain-containing protein [Fusobacteriaceae bacterium]